LCQARRIRSHFQ